jgi:hypothetical protein
MFPGRVAPLLLVIALAVGHGASARANLCEDALERPLQPRRAARDPLGLIVSRVWNRVYGPFFDATGRETELVLLSAEARTRAGRPFPAIAMTCGRRKGLPAVIVADAFLTGPARSGGGLDEAFLALVLGHELAHRQHDFSPAGAFRGPADEPRADRHGAFIAASAGYRTDRMICEDRLERYLASEDVPEASRDARRAVLPEVLRRFEMWETVFTAATGLTFLDPSAASGLLAAARAALAESGEALVEFTFLEAVALMQDAAAGGCWTDIAVAPGLPVDDIRCVPVLASAAGLRPPPAPPAELTVRGCDEGAMRKLERAATLLDGLTAEQVSPVGLSTARGCVTAYMGEVKEARGHFEAALAALPARAPAPVVAALKANRAFAEWLAFLAEPAQRPPGASAEAAVVAAWRRLLSRARRTFAPHPNVDAWVAAALGEKPRTRRDGFAARAPRCTAPPPSPLAPSTLPPIPEAPPSGGCPCGWFETATFADPLAPTPADGLVRVCAPAGGEGVGESRLVGAALPMRGVAQRVHLHRPMAGPMAALSTYLGACDALTLGGVNARGEELWHGPCPELGAPSVLLFADGCHVRGVLQVPVSVGHGAPTTPESP